ncbi:glucokinase [Alsobacter metallidurans]|uniref:Glucokinase n=1 Tax=Alsobacter metallidurans TaxID=340221 RepID=A0A917I3I5_9HYPH|nr:ROK family protein [Alsobacter metallidurans]GGH10644.1 glucokinase [Alsobacter metallidurans]
MPARETPKGPHGAFDLPSVTIDSYNLEVRHQDGFIGDRASKRAFVEVLEDWRERFRQYDEDPLGDKPSSQIGKKKLEEIFLNGDPDAVGIIHGAVEDFSQELAAVTRRFLRTKGWENTQNIAVGGGFRQGRLGELVIGRTSGLLKGSGHDVKLMPIRQHPDHAGLIGVAHLIPPWALEGHQALIGVDIGGSNIRAGVVTLNMQKEKDLSLAEVWKTELWRHADDKPKRTSAVKRLVEMVRDLIARAEKEGMKLAPIIGVGCPGVIEPDGSIDRGGQNLPGGNWESDHFNLPELIAKEIPSIGKHDTTVLMHNDAVVQGLSQIPFMADVAHWGILTIGTGLGNARFTNKAAVKGKKAG